MLYIDICLSEMHKYSLCLTSATTSANDPWKKAPMASEMTCVNEASRTCCKLLQVLVKLILTESSDSVYLGWLFGALVDKSILDFDNYDVGVKQLFQLAFMPNNTLLPIPNPTFLCKSPKIKYTRLSTWSIWCELQSFGYIIGRYACFLFNYNISACSKIYKTQK